MRTLDWSIEERRGIYTRGMWIRACAAGMFIMFFCGLRMAGPGKLIEGYWEVIVILACLILVNPLLWRFGKRRSFPLTDFYGHWGIDLVAVTMIIVALGIFDVQLTVFAYVIMLMSSATFANRRTAMVLTIAAVLCFVLAVASEANGLIAHRHVGFAYHYDIEGRWFLGSAAVVLLLVFGVLAGELADMMHAKAQELENARVKIQQAFQREHAARANVGLLSMLVQHDVYSPLSVIAAAASFVSRGVQVGEWQEVRRYADVILERIESVEAALKTLGSFADEITEGSVVNDLEGVARDLMHHLEGEIRDRKADIDVRGEWPMVKVSYAEIYHVLRNLVTNALKAVDDDGTGRIEIAGAKTDDGGWVMTIRDNGQGMGEDERANVLRKPLGRLGHPGAGGGFGLGLTLSRNLVQGWGGGITVETCKPRGTKFAVSLPADRVEPPRQTAVRR